MAIGFGSFGSGSVQLKHLGGSACPTEGCSGHLIRDGSVSAPQQMIVRCPKCGTVRCARCGATAVKGEAGYHCSAKCQ